MKRKGEIIKSNAKKYTLVITTNVIAWWLQYLKLSLELWGSNVGEPMF
jgi:hypothetical protein